jgi:hypothetical protein
MAHGGERRCEFEGCGKRVREEGRKDAVYCKTHDGDRESMEIVWEQ